MDHLCSLIRGVPISIWGAFIPALDCWWPRKKSRGCGELAPAGLPFPQSPPEVYVIYSVWEQIDPLLFELSMSRLPFHSLRLIRDLRRDYMCTHAHTYQHTALSLVSALPLAFGRGIVQCMNASFLLCFHDFGWRAERCAVLLTGDYSTVNETLAHVWDIKGTLLSLRH